MTGHAILLDQVLVEWRRGERLGDRLAERCQTADVSRFVARDTTR
jgi:hypothetical protein